MRHTIIALFASLLFLLALPHATYAQKQQSIQKREGALPDYTNNLKFTRFMEDKLIPRFRKDLPMYTLIYDDHAESQEFIAGANIIAIFVYKDEMGNVSRYLEWIKIDAKDTTKAKVRSYNLKGDVWVFEQEQDCPTKPNPQSEPEQEPQK